MPQVNLSKGRAAVGVPEKGTYARKVENGVKAPVISAKTERAANSQNQNFTKALGTMIRNAEMLTAGKLLQEGRILL